MIAVRSASRLAAAVIGTALAAVPLAAQPYLVKNINTVAGEAVDSLPNFYAVVGGKAVFAADSTEVGQELWTSDGTAAGTAPLRDLVAGQGGSLPRPGWSAGGLFYFLASTAGRDLWRTDGTVAGTFQLTFGVEVLFLVGRIPDRGLVVFSVLDAEHGVEPWVSDGTAAGTHLIADLAPGELAGLSPYGGLTMDDTLLFFSNRGGGVVELWRTDGTAAGTAFVTEVPAGPFGFGPQRITTFGSGLLFFAEEPAHGQELWTTDGTAAGTHLVRDLTPGPASTTFISPGVAVIGDLALFMTSTAVSSTLYRTDGTEGGTIPLVTFASPYPFPSGYQDFLAIDGRLYLTVDDGVHGFEPWISDGTVAGTHLLRDGCPGPCSSIAKTFVPTSIGVTFTANDGVHGEEGWVTDGTTAGTHLIADLCPGSCQGGGSLFGSFEGGVVLLGYTETFRQQLWASLGTPASTVRITDFSHGCAFCNGGAYGPGLAVGDLFVFHADDGTHGDELWRTDGTPGGTYLLRDLAFQGDAGSSPTGLLTVGNRVFFAADDGVHGREPWRSDGSAAGTVQIAEILPDNEQAQFAEFRAFGAVGGLAYYGLTRQDLGTDQLWRSDGSAAGTVRLLEVNLGSHGLFGIAPRPGGGVFVLGGSGVWVSDGTAAGTHRVRELLVPNRAAGPAGFGLLDGELYFSATDDFVFPDYELWKSDGTALGTVRVADIDTNNDGNPGDFFAFQGRLYFSAGDSEHGRELWRTDGTEAGTERVADLAEGFDSSNPFGLATVGGRLLFFTEAGPTGPALWRLTAAGSTPVRLANVAPPRFPFGGPFAATAAGAHFFLGRSGTDPHVLWVSDGTAAGTHSLPALLPAGRQAVRLWAAGGRLLILAGDEFQATDLWVSDGTSAGTHRVADLTSFYVQTPLFSEMAFLGSTALFPASDAEFGDELRRVDLTQFLPPPVQQVPPAAPSGLTAEAISAHEVRLTWQDNSTDETRFEVGRSSPYAGGFPEVVASVAAGATTLTVSGLNPGEPYTFQVRAVNGFGASFWSAEASATPFAEDPAPCAASAEALCLLGGRFEVRVQWRDQHNGGHGIGTAVPFPGSGRTGLFWFFNPENIELVVKNLDGSTVNGFIWTFYGALSDVEYWITVTDTEEGRNRTYHNVPGTICGEGDTASFPEAVPAGGSVAGTEASRAATAFPLAAATPSEISTAAAAGTGGGTCAPGPQTLCLQDGRFAVEVDWHDQHNGGDGVGTAIPSTDLSGYFWFFNPTNVELVVKILDATTVNGHFWVFYGALSDVEYTIRVTDTVTGDQRTYPNAPGNICGRADTEAF